MLNFDPVRIADVPLMECVGDLGPNDLKTITDDFIDHVLTLISDCTDEDVIFEPLDAEAHDPYAATAEEVDMPWTLGHVIVHITASAEERKNFSILSSSPRLPFPIHILEWSPVQRSR